MSDIIVSPYFSQQIEKTNQIQDNIQKCEEWRQRSENLLYAMIPKTIAVRLKQGEDPINTCEVSLACTLQPSDHILCHIKRSS